MNDIKEPQELISIVLPTYNSEKYVSSTINSVISQTYTNWELIITDDASTDSTYKILQQYRDRDDRIKVQRLKVNSGAAVSRNKALQSCRSHLIAFLDSDDSWCNQKLAYQIDFMKENRCPISFTSYKLIDENGKDLNRIVKTKEKVNYRNYLKNTIIGMSTSMVNTSITGPLSFKNIRTRQDTYLWITLLKKGFVAYGIKKPLAFYRVRNDSVSSNKIRAAKQVWKLYFVYEDLGLFKAIYYFCFYIFHALKKRYL